MSVRRCFFLPAVLILLAVACGSVTAQPVGKIVPNPKAVRLRELWRLEGGNGLRYVGHSSGSLGIGPNGLGMWAVYAGVDDINTHWYIYHGSKDSLSTVPVQDKQGLGSVAISPIVGRFWEDSRIGVGLIKITPDTISGVSTFYRTLMIYEMHEGLLADTARVQIDMSSRNGICLADVQAADLDGDGDDEVIVAAACDYPKLRIYKGGPEFNGDEPDKIIVGPSKLISSGSSVFTVAISNLDNDSLPDIVTWNELSGEGFLYFYLSTQHSPWDWSTPDKTRRLLTRPSKPNPYPEPLRGILPIDLNGDGLGDFYGFVTSTDTAGIYIWLSAPERDILSRPFDSSDYDVYIPATGYIMRPWRVGPLNDSLKRYDMLALAYDPTGTGDIPMHFYSGGPNGPDASYDAWAADESGHVFLRVSPLPDVNGDGWPDMLTSYFPWGGNRGIAVIYGGGPEIPREHTSGVREEPVAGESGGLYLWPNPVVDRLNIAWRGNLKQMPHRFQVHDIGGMLIAEGDIDPSLGSALWSCGDVASGRYILLGYDHFGSVVSHSLFVKI